MAEDRKRIYETLNVGLFAFVEDDFSFDPTKAHVMLDFTRMFPDDRAALLMAIPSGTTGKDALIAYANEVTSWIHDVEWEKAPQDDIEYVLKDKPHVQALYSAVPEELWTGTQSQLFFQFSLGATIPDILKPLFREVIRSSPVYLPTRIYTTYIEDTHQALLLDLKTCSNYRKSATLVLDNRVGSDLLATQMINDLKAIPSEIRVPVYATIFSTAPKTDPSEVCETPDLYIGYAKKSDGLGGVDKNILRAAINSFLSAYKKKYKTAIENSCNTLAKNPDLVEYLYGMARAEGEAGYEVLQQWFFFMLNHEMENSPELIELMKLSSCVESYETATNYGLDVPKDLLPAAVSENFLTAVNKYCTATAPGDIFDYKGQLFVLVGQDCDYMMGEQRTRNAPLCELVSAEIIPQTCIDKLNNDQKYVFVGNYQDDTGQPCILKVDYTTRKIISNEIINLCSFNQEGRCRINYNEDLPKDVAQLIQPYMLDYYKELVEYFLSVRKVKDAVPGFYESLAKLKTVKPLVSMTEYEETGTTIDYGIRRVSRLKKTASLYLYKMFLEYRGRMPYTSINLVGYTALNVTLKMQEKTWDCTAYIKLTNNRRKNLEAAKPKDKLKLSWFVKKSDLQNAIHTFWEETHTLTSESEFLELQGNKACSFECNTGSVTLEKKINADAFLIDISGAF